MGKRSAFSEKARDKAQPHAHSSLAGVVIDAGGLIALERSDRRVGLILEAAQLSRSRVLIPATVLAQVIRDPARQARIQRLLQREGTELVPLDGIYAQAVGLLLAKTGLSDIVDAHVVVCAQEGDFDVITSDARDLLRLDPLLAIVAV